MDSQSVIEPAPRSVEEIEVEARRMRAQVLRGAGVAIGRSVARLFGRGAGARLVGRA